LFFCPFFGISLASLFSAFSAEKMTRTKVKNQDHKGEYGYRGLSYPWRARVGSGEWEEMHPQLAKREGIFHTGQEKSYLLAKVKQQ
jgi:hypothetical protein